MVGSLFLCSAGLCRMCDAVEPKSVVINFRATPLMEALAYALELAAVERSEQAGPPSRRCPQPLKESR